MSDTSSVLRALSLTKSYGRRVVVREVGLEIRQGEVVGLLGPNGAGKTTTFYMVVGLARPDSGQVFLADEDITALPMYQRARLGIGFSALNAVPWNTAGRKPADQLAGPVCGTPRGSGMATKAGRSSHSVPSA